MSKERKSLKVMSLMFWVLSLVMIAGSIHGFVKGVIGISLSMFVIGFAGLFYGKKGIVGANTPSKVGALPSMSLWLGIIVVVWAVLIGVGFIPAGPHTQMVSLILFGLVALVLFAMNYFAKKVAEQVSL